MNLIKSAPAVILGALLLAGCGQEDSVKLENHVDQASYGVGLNIGRQLSREEVDMNADAIAAGIKDALANAEPRIGEDVIKAAFDKIREEQTMKQEALNDAAAKAGQDFLAENAKREGVTVTESGLQYEVMVAAADGQPMPEASDTVRVHYHGTLIDGTVFDSSVERGEPAQFPVTGVIRGWVEALQMMKVGDKWKLFIPAELAYGARSPSPRIPANSALVFEVELLDIVK
ncbi:MULTISPECIES: FKBP-type peptidyl-prolyl cis-trans isomerase [Oceanospirillaceae]|uniref:FKBP-type peptidyl-prolyl cis-trans isomerase n=1 Tax=Oceanospirillaceae TaxID=135620 RepID=UPI000C4E7672|nr:MULTISPECIES: FKBP-type peptidyl-prolyl cis-trans isomerase [Thalassolituus]MAY15255.1 peptidylprolyl isomerase [Oceanospirillaceae bacterium]MBU2039992.1 FKBP-type peptidyl-prolyl cis-trans isomerase [Gammaproteobacteria bacterium]PIQ39749.1 MAG: peptidylprolyl isomerase [Thalassolituus sp. CG17_big_fil_post_rev_8_21_14_2_50_53_8]MCA6058241.1 FKBP-type peptidyl-prolyl cis-trans isomerase [Thalassolituus sp. ST750PaO-4]MCB2386639.1 FKBP-type peptidyl-prolyl cis-trans isomerase [Thalassolitu